MRSHSSAQAESETIRQKIHSTKARKRIITGICSLYGFVHRAYRWASRKQVYGHQGHVADATFCPMQTKCTLAFTSILMLIMWPATILLGLIDTVQHTVFEEPPDYRARKSSGGGISGTKLHCTSNLSRSANPFAVIPPLMNAGHAVLLLCLP